MADQALPAQPVGDTPRAPETSYIKGAIVLGTLAAVVAGLVLTGLAPHVTKVPVGDAFRYAADVSVFGGLMHVIVLIACIIAVAKGAEWLVESAVRIANRFGISEVVIGLTVVAFGTSAPEFAVSVSAGLQKEGSIAIGNVVGSNIFNLGFILGGVALITPIVVAKRVVSRDGVFLILSTVVLFLFLADQRLQLVEGIIMFGGLIVYMGILLFFRGAKQKKPDLAPPVDPLTDTPGSGHKLVTRMIFPQKPSGRQPTVEGEEPAAEEPPDDFEIEEMPKEKATWKDVPIFMAGLAAVILGCHMLVGSALYYSVAFEIPTWAVAVTIVAAGTSAPEIAVSLVAAIKGHHEIAAGNLIGSDLFNILGVLGLAAILNIAISDRELSIDNTQSDRSGALTSPDGENQGEEITGEPASMPTEPTAPAAEPGFNLDPSSWNAVQWSLVSLIGMVLLTVFFLWTGYRVSRLEGGILVLIAIGRMTFDLFGRNIMGPGH